MSSSNPRKQVFRHDIDRARTAATQLITSYFKNMDSMRSALKPLYKDTSSISWNGHAYTGLSFRQFYLEMPATVHTIEACDGSPILASRNPDGSCSFLISVFGYVQFTSERTKWNFHSTFFLTPDQAQLYIATQCFRWV